MRKEQMMQEWKEYRQSNTMPFDGWVIEVYVEEEKSLDKWHSISYAANECEANERFDAFAAKYPCDKFRIKAPSHLSHSIVRETHVD